MLQVSSPLLILHGEADTVTDPLVSQLLYEKASSKDKTLKLYQDAYHCILQGEPDDTIFTVLDDIVTWLDSRCFRTNVISNPPMLQLIHFCISLQHYDTVPVLELNLVEDDNITSYSFKVRTSRPPKVASLSSASNNPTYIIYFPKISHHLSKNNITSTHIFDVFYNTPEYKNNYVSKRWISSLSTYKYQLMYQLSALRFKYSALL